MFLKVLRWSFASHDLREWLKVVLHALLIAAVLYVGEKLDTAQWKTTQAVHNLDTHILTVTTDLGRPLEVQVDR